VVLQKVIITVRLESDKELKELINNKNIAAWISVVALIPAAVVLWPYGYYTLLRWVITITASFVAYTANQLNRSGWMWAFVIVALLFNPIAPVHLDRETWVVIDLIVAAIFLISIFKVKNHERKN